MTEYPILEISLEAAHIVPEQYLSYHYYGALCFIAVKEYPMALELLSNCITIPSVACSAISLLAHRTAVLVSLLHTGARFRLPKFTSSVVKLAIQSSALTKQYLAIEAAFLQEHKLGSLGGGGGGGGSGSSSSPAAGESSAGLSTVLEETDASNSSSNSSSSQSSNKADKDKDKDKDKDRDRCFQPALVTAIESSQGPLAEDGNLGLARSLVPAQLKLHLAMLTKIYITLSLAAMAEHLNLPTAQEAEKILLSLIYEGKLHARIHQPSGMVSFIDASPSSSGSMGVGIESKLLDNIKVTIALQQKIEDLRCGVLASKEYMQSITSSSSSASASSASSAAAGAANAERVRGRGGAAEPGGAGEAVPWGAPTPQQ